MSFRWPFSIKVMRDTPQMIIPAKPTPRELKKLSDIDDQEGLRFQVPVTMFYRSSSFMDSKGRDPVEVIKDAVSKALVPYYPFAGRLKEGPNRKLSVDCNGDGVMFVEAQADVTLEQLGDTILSPCPFLNEFLCNVPGSDGITECPLLLIQVTRFLCGGFVLALRHNHTMADGSGFVQFLQAVAEFAGDATEPTVKPVWQREIFNARDPPRITCIHTECGTRLHDTKVSDIAKDHPADVLEKGFYFGPREIQILRGHLPVPVRNSCTRFELITACMWKCRTIALKLDPEENVYCSCTINVRGKNSSTHVPLGYYGNAFAFPVVASTAGDICKSSLAYVVELIKDLKTSVTSEYIQSVADFMAIKGRPGLTTKQLMIFSDNSRAGYDDIDLVGVNRCSPEFLEGYLLLPSACAIGNQA